MSRRSTAPLLGLLALAASTSACATVTKLSQRTQTARLRVEARKPGTAIYRDGQLVGRTPTTLTLRYQLIEERRFHGDHLLGGVGALGASALSVGFGASLLWLSEHQPLEFFTPEEERGSDTGLRAYAVGFFVAAAALLGGAIYLLTRPRQRYRRTLPTTITLQLREPDQYKLHDARVDLPTTGDTLKPLSFDGQRFRRGPLPRKPDPAEQLLTMRRPRRARRDATGPWARETSCFGDTTGVRVCARSSRSSLPPTVLKVLAIALHRALALPPRGERAAGWVVELDARRIERRCALVFHLRAPGRERSEPYGSMPQGCDSAALLRGLETAARGLRRELVTTGAAK